ncbi:MAG TPA: serine/threonine-protein kinase [Gallionellaceae bacterium]|nr:serine/threonine-protein kinase [Gallionellaceae bacterium]
MAMINHLGRYEIIGELGQGAMGIVYKAKDPLIDRVVAIKTINLNQAMDEREEYEARFYQEARAAGRLSHHNIVTIYDVGKSGDVAYIAMEFLEGRELRDVLNEKSVLPLGQVLDIVAQVAQGLAYAHEHGIVHRDVKPSNIMIQKEGHVKITDFGIARMASAAVRTQTGMVLGSPKYMSPEQVMGKLTDQRSDIFSLGTMLYEMLTGRPPFSGENVNAIMYQTLNASPPQPSSLNPAVPDMLNFIVAKALAKKMDERYQNANEFADDLRTCRDSMPQVSMAVAPRQQPKSPMDAALAAGTTMSEDEGGVPVATRGLSGAFDSLAATLRLAAMTNDEKEVEEISKTLKMARPDFSKAVPPPVMAVPNKPKPIPAPPAPSTARQPSAALEDSDETEDNSGGSGNLLLIAIIVLVLIGVVLFVLF